MSEERFTISGDDSVADDQQHSAHLTPLLRFLPAIHFGIRTAALAGLVVSGGAAALGLAGTFDDVSAMNTTCCGSPMR